MSIKQKNRRKSNINKPRFKKFFKIKAEIENLLAETFGFEMRLVRFKIEIKIENSKL